MDLLKIISPDYDCRFRIRLKYCTTENGDSPLIHVQYENYIQLR